MSTDPLPSKSRCSNTLSNCKPQCLLTIFFTKSKNHIRSASSTSRSWNTRSDSCAHRRTTAPRSFFTLPTMLTPCHTLDRSRMLYV